MRFPFCVLFCICLLCAACQPENQHISPAFYHWKSSFAPSEFETRSLAQLKVQRLYLRYFDLTYSLARAEVIPVAKLNYAPLSAPTQEIIPTVYLTNQAILKTPAANIDSLGKKMLGLLFRLHAEGPGTPLREVQIDCDWTSRSRERYFALLRYLRSELQAQDILLSTTVRLHQLKFRERTGVPPVDRGMLMFYNMGNLDDPEEQNSILNLNLGRSYLETYQPYPLPLDLALPLFSWGVLVRDGQPIRLLSNLHPTHLQGQASFKKIDDNHVKVGKSRYFRGEYLYEGDVIRTETVTEAELLDAADLLAQTLPQDSIHIALYHLDSLTLQHYELETLAAVFDAFRR